MSYPIFNENSHGAHLNEMSKCYYLDGWNVYNMSDTIKFER